MLFNLTEPPDFLVYYNANKVNKPNEGSTEEHNNGNYDSCGVLNVNALDKAVDSPHDVEYGDTEDKLCYKRKLVHSLEKFFHR